MPRKSLIATKPQPRVQKKPATPTVKVAWGLPDEDVTRPPLEPVAVEPVEPIEPTKFDPHEGEKVTLLYGYGRVYPNITHFVDELVFKGGVCRGVSYKRAREVKLSYGVGDGITIMPDASTEKDWIRAVGIDPHNLPQLPRQWVGTRNQFDELIDMYGVEGVRAMAKDLDREVYRNSRLLKS